MAKKKSEDFRGLKIGLASEADQHTRREVGCGVIYLKNSEDEIHHAFEYARDIGARTAVIGINRETIPAVSKVIRDFDLHAAIHNHGPQDKTGAYSPLDVME